MDKKEILTTALNARIEELFSYQINIDNYRLAIEHIDTLLDESLFPFRDQLSSLLASEILEQKKALVIKTVIEQQLKE